MIGCCFPQQCSSRHGFWSSRIFIGCMQRCRSKQTNTKEGLFCIITKADGDVVCFVATKSRIHFRIVYYYFSNSGRCLSLAAQHFYLLVIAQPLYDSTHASAAAFESLLLLALDASTAKCSAASRSVDCHMLSPLQVRRLTH